MKESIWIGGISKFYRESRIKVCHRKQILHCVLKGKKEKC